MPLATLRNRVATLDTRSARPAPKVADRFYGTPAWRQARALAIAAHLFRCAGCGASGGRLYVDHIVELADGGAPYEQANLRPLCGSCHTAKTVTARAERMRG